MKKKIIFLLMLLSHQFLMAQQAPKAIARLNELGKKEHFGEAELKEARELMLLIINEGRANPNYRKEKGCKTALNLPSNLEPLRLSDANNNFAQTQANYMARIKTVTHANTDFGDDLNNNQMSRARCTAFNLYGSEACSGPSGDNLGEEPGGWMKSETHYRPTWNLDGTDESKAGYPNNGYKYNSVGFGMARNDGRWYVVGFWNRLEKEPTDPRNTTYVPISNIGTNNNNNSSVSTTNAGTSGEEALWKGAIFYTGHKIYSANKQYYYAIENGDLVVKTSNGTLKWSAKQTRGHKAIFQEDGNFCLQDKDNRWVWGTQQFGDKLVLENDGRLLQYNKDKVIWDSSKNQ